MSIRSSIENLFNNNTNYTTPDQATNQASSLDALSTDLYTDSKRFIYELLQNADDSPEQGSTVKVWIKSFDDVLVLAHSGKVFDEKDVRGLCNVNNGTKKDDASKTGYKGIGFKSVFGQSEKVTIYTNSEYFRFDSSFPFGWQWDESKENWERNNGRKFVHPWQIIPIYTDYNEVLSPVHQYLKAINAKVATIINLDNINETLLAVQELSTDVNMFLFLKNIAEINFDLNNITRLEINRLNTDYVEIKINNDIKARWLINTINLGVPSELSSSLADERNIPDKLLYAKNMELTLAAKVDEDGVSELKASEKLLYSYLPTDEKKYQLPVLVNTSFLTNANREHLHTNSKWNQWLFKNIAIELFKWISVLVTSQLKFQAYRLIPKKIHNDELGKYFNFGIDNAIRTVEFVLTKRDRLIKVENAIVDFTYLSEKTFVGEEEIRKILNESDTTGVSRFKSFVQNSGFGHVIQSLGADSFEWNDVPRLLKSARFAKDHSIDKNIELIRHLKYLSEKSSVIGVTDEVLSKWPFIIDHKNKLNIPSEIYFPTADDDNWNDPNNELAFLHIHIQQWLSATPDMREWVEKLGVVEKTDISFITKTLIPNSERFINKGNAIQAIRDLFNLYKKGVLNSDLLAQLSDLKLLTNRGNLIAAKNCILSNSYAPRLEIDEILQVDIFVSAAYISDTTDKDEWKVFFKLLKVSDGIPLVSYEDRINKILLIADGCKEDYFNIDDKIFSPHISSFISNEYKNISTLRFINKAICNYSFSKLYWQDVISNNSPLKLSNSAIAFWGNSGRDGRTKGDSVENYIPWIVKNLSVIPVASKECKRSPEIFLNTDEIKELAGEYLPVFDGVELSADWKSFFKFRTKLELADYLDLLSKISNDVTEKKEIKRSNVIRVQLIYKQLIDFCVNWGESELNAISEWSKSGQLLTDNKEFLSCEDINYFMDGNNVIFQGQIKFLEINHENRQNPNIIYFLNTLNINVLEYNDFTLEVENVYTDTTLIECLSSVIPFFKAWVESESEDDKTKKSLVQLESKAAELDFYEAIKLQITYKAISFTKDVNVHLDNNNLYVTKPWKSSKVLLQLPGVLCRHFDLAGHDKKLHFLLCSTVGEILEYFDQESIYVPVGITLEKEADTGELKDINVATSPSKAKSFDEIKTAIGNGESLDFFHIPTSDYQRLLYVEKLISRAVTNILKYLENLPEYNCEYHFEIAPSIIGGITKNGQDLTIIARPSDNDTVLLYYTSEFDVLEYVDAEFWCEDGENVPQKITLGHLLKMTKINKIPISNLAFEDEELEKFSKNKKSVDFEFDAVPSSPFKVAQIISSFANTKGGTLIYGINKVGEENRFVGLSTDFRMDDIIKKALIMISPLPAVTYDWINVKGKKLFVVKVEKSDKSMSIGEKTYVRDGHQTNLQMGLLPNAIDTLAFSDIEKTVAIIIGIEDYKPRNSNQIRPVKYAKADAELFKCMLINQFKVDEDDIHMLINENALKSDLEYGLKSLFYSLSEKDRLIFYYVGHGFHSGTTNYLSTYDTHINNISETAVSIRKILLDPLLRSKCKSGLVFIDACAQSITVDNERAMITDLNTEDFQLFKSDHPHFATFLSCLPGESSYSCHDLEHGVWTYYLNKALSGKEKKVLKSEKYVTDRALSDYLAKVVSDYTKNKFDNNQNPKAIIDSTCENIIVEI
jgi:hypothetical protein